MTTSFNPAQLLALKPELDRSLAEISQELEHFFSGERSAPAIATALDELHRVGGVLKILKLQGLVVFCAELETLLRDLADQPGSTGAMQQDAIRRALFGLTHYLDGLAAGAPNATLRLFGEYQGLMQARGVDIAFESDLFFPDLDVELPAPVLADAQQSEAARRIKGVRMAYQQALLKWLRQDDPMAALRAMMASIRVVLTCAPQNRQRAFWWVAGGLLNCILHDGVPPELNVKKALSRIDQRMRALIENTPFDEDAALWDMLYLIARSHTVSETVEAIKQTYALDAYLPEPSPLPPSETTALLEQLRAQLAVADETWERCVGDDSGACLAFTQQAEQLYVLSEQLERNTLQFLCKQINNIAIHTDAPERAQRVGMDMAMALLLLGSGIEHYQHLGSGFHEQARLLSMRMQSGLMQKPEDSAKLSNLIALYCEMEQREIMAPLANEMENNLQHIEQSLSAFFGDAGKRAELLQVNRLLSQVQGGLHLLSLDVAEHLLTTLRTLTERYQQGTTPAAAEMRAVAAALSTLDQYVHGLALGQKPDTQALAEALKTLLAISAGEVTEAAPPETLPEPAGVSIRSGDEDAELLEVFLEEAQDVMETLRSNLEVARLHPDSREPWITIRRSFHTLKGSSRMVGLNTFGEVAWAVERAMNKWLAQNTPATPALLDMAGDAEVLFQHWVDMLKNGATTAHIDTSHLLETADCIEHGREPPKPLVPAPAAVESKPAAAEETSVQIGTVSISPVLFRIATEEAAQHVAALKAHYASLCEDFDHVVSYDFMRAAHTLAGVNRTLGFPAIAELAYALEQWLTAHMDKAGVIGDTQLALLNEAISALDTLCAGVRERREPAAQDALIARLNAEHTPAQDAAAAAIAATSAVAAESVAAEAATVMPAVEPAATETVLPAAPETTPAPAVTASAEPEPAATPVAEPAPAASAPHAAQERVVHDEIDAQLLPIFLEEAHELLPQIGATLRTWHAQPEDAQTARLLQRSLHTLKGSARMAGAMRLGELTHRMEDRVNQAISAQAPDEALWNELDNYLDRIAAAIERLQPQGAVEMPAAAAPVAPPETAAAPAVPTLGIGAERAMQAALLRVRSDTVDRLVNEAGEISVARARADAELGEFRNAVLELTDSVTRLRKQLREIEIQAESQMQARTAVSGDTAHPFDPLEFDRFTRLQELTRFMNESVHDVQTVQQTLLRNLDETTAALNAQAQLNRDLQQELMAIRMVPFSSISERLYRIARQTGKELGKRVNLDLVGAEIELDRSVLEKMAAPFEHLLRNAIAHGLESTEERAQAGKPPIGEIRLALRQEANEVVFELSDDGRGLNLARIRAKARERGLTGAGEDISDEQAMQLIFAPSFSTAQEVTEISGRGVGLDVVQSEVTALGGRVDVASTPGQGARFSIHLPLTLAVTRTVMVKCGAQTYALPASMVEHIQQLKPAELAQAYRDGHVQWQGRTYPLHALSRLLGDMAEILSLPHNPVLLLKSGEHRIALHVEALLGNRESVVKNIGPQLARLPGIAGATVSPSGAVILILNPIAFTQRIATPQQAEAPTTTAAPVETVRAKPLVMVVDDSLTVRKITGRLLERAGYEVVTAKDGVDALEQLSEIEPAVMLLDIEMPRMDGFEVTKRLRQDSKTKALPIIMITSRTADKHRNYARELGVNEYLGKPYQEEELLDHIARLI